ncbi:MAG: L,D-transpeptidase, partial [Longimicrobiales bacterium]
SSAASYVYKRQRGRNVLDGADRAAGTKILVSTEDRWLWLVSGRDTLLSVPVAIGMGRAFEFEGKRFWFETPRSQRKVLGKQAEPRWTVPEWHYMERAKAMGHELVRLEKDTKHLLDDGTFLLTIGSNVGRLNEYGNFWAFPPGMEIIFDGKVFIPPMGTEQRAVPDALGPYKLDTGDGYLIHGTNIFNEESIGEAVSHGCVRMRNEDLVALYASVPVGTAVFIF